jgi:hypothetical protein
MRFVAIKKWKDGGESVAEYFATRAECLEWISKQSKLDSFEWIVGEYA